MDKSDRVWSPFHNLDIGPIYPTWICDRGDKSFTLEEQLVIGFVTGVRHELARYPPLWKGPASCRWRLLQRLQRLRL